MSAVLGGKHLLVYGGSAIQGDHSDVTLYNLAELLDPENSTEIDKIA